jgi:hypothetical protein
VAADPASEPLRAAVAATPSDTAVVIVLVLVTCAPKFAK